MKITTFREQHFICKYCRRKMDVTEREYKANPFCSHCYEERLIASGSINLRGSQKDIK